MFLNGFTCWSIGRKVTRDLSVEAADESAEAAGDQSVVTGETRQSFYIMIQLAPQRPNLSVDLLTFLLWQVLLYRVIHVLKHKTTDFEKTPRLARNWIRETSVIPSHGGSVSRLVLYCKVRKFEENLVLRRKSILICTWYIGEYKKQWVIYKYMAKRVTALG